MSNFKVRKRYFLTEKYVYGFYSKLFFDLSSEYTKKRFQHCLQQPIFEKNVIGLQKVFVMWVDQSV